MKYEDITMLDAPVLEDGVEVFGYLRIHRRQVKKKEASRVVILVTRSLLNIIEASKDNLIHLTWCIVCRKNAAMM
ncbi:TPA: hypothetical protein ACGUMO_000240 [Vibrio vulnificus]